MSTALKSTMFIAVLCANVFGAGYILPNGTILYDGSQDPSMYRVEKLSLQSQPSYGAETTTVVAEVAQPIQTTRIIVENRPVRYESPVYIRERIIDRRPVYDVVTVTGALLMYGLIYDSARRSFYHHELHRGYPSHRYPR
jgi:hypothetical protein